MRRRDFIGLLGGTAILFGVGVDGNPSRHDDVCPVFDQMI